MQIHCILTHNPLAHPFSETIVRPSTWFLIVATLLAGPSLWSFWKNDPFYSVGLIVLPWSYWQTLKVNGDATGPRGAVMLASGALLLFGFFQAHVFSLHLGLVLALVTIQLDRGTKQLLPPLMLFLTVPPPGFAWFLNQLQLFVAAMTDTLLALIGTPVVREATSLQGVYKYDVAPLCSGLTGVLATMLLIGMAGHHLKTPLKRLGIALAIGTVATTLLNVFRVTILVWLTERNGPKYIQGGFHDGVSLVMSAIAFIFILPFVMPKKPLTLEAPDEEE